MDHTVVMTTDGLFYLYTCSPEEALQEFLDPDYGWTGYTLNDVECLVVEECRCDLG